MFKLKNVTDLTGIKGHGDAKHFKIERNGTRHAEALIERKALFLFHIHAYEQVNGRGNVICNKTVFWPTLVLIVYQIGKGKREFK